MEAMEPTPWRPVFHSNSFCNEVRSLFDSGMEMKLGEMDGELPVYSRRPRDEMVPVSHATEKSVGPRDEK